MMRRKCVLVLCLVLGLSIFNDAKSKELSSRKLLSVNTTLADPAEMMRRSLDELTKTVPLAYNEPVKKMINYYLSSQKPRFSRVLGLSQYYFPIYEKIFAERGVPEEIKYLSIVESSLNPFALSTAQAGGLWQFLEPVGKLYGLAINDTIDERRDPFLACNAAASYLLDSYNMYGDWLLAIASYNCGRNNIRWAMEKADGAKDYWTLRKYLPLETQSYVPAYIATVYIMNNARKHGLYAAHPNFDISTKEITVRRPVTLQSIARAVNVSLSDLCVLNASYKNQVINGNASCPKKLVIPEVKDYLHNALCDVLKTPGKLERELKLVYTIPEPPKPKIVIAQVAPPKPAVQPKYKVVDVYINYKVKEGDTLSSIVEKFNSTEEEVKILNRLKHYSVKPGMTLKIIQG